ncbi:MAG TPA: YggS family pyridoxal phosphate-dependent enzyme [Candidatus Limnocylindrales bacterium]|nr:YggS family pyridoxal phosphate-dependent enzyme [Candidatus Limnocylindrales bacterium]
MGTPPDGHGASDHGEVAPVADARDHVLARIADACARVGREPASVAMVAVSKTVPAVRLREAVAAGLTILGENRVQEAEAKAAEVPGATWHLVGPLQSNKARRALDTFAVIESVHSIGLAVRLDGLVRSAVGGDPYPVLLQVNVDRDPAKSGFVADELEAAIESLDANDCLEYRGLMTVGRLTDHPEAARPGFLALRTLSERLRSRWPRLGGELSMGMSDDFEIAIEEGATVVRIGRALFGHRH